MHALTQIEVSILQDAIESSPEACIVCSLECQDRLQPASGHCPRVSALERVRKLLDRATEIGYA